MSRGGRNKFKDKFYRTLNLDKETRELLKFYKKITKLMMQDKGHGK